MCGLQVPHDPGKSLGIFSGPKNSLVLVNSRAAPVCTQGSSGSARRANPSVGLGGCEEVAHSAYGPGRVRRSNPLSKPPFLLDKGNQGIVINIFLHQIMHGFVDKNSLIIRRMGCIPQCEVSLSSRSSMFQPVLDSSELLFSHFGPD
jgi:hypothetical protein